MTTEPTLDVEAHRQVAVILHMYEHARARAGTWMLSEPEMVHTCWGYPIIGLDDVPDWAVEAAAAGKPSASWCPILNPRLQEG